nr:unnamed protein product [Callosobruchus analis]
MEKRKGFREKSDIQVQNLNRNVGSSPSIPARSTSFFASSISDEVCDDDAVEESELLVSVPESEPAIKQYPYKLHDMQVVCDRTCKILDVFMGYPRSVHDSRVYRNSPLKQNLQQKCGRYFSIG